MMIRQMSVLVLMGVLLALPASADWEFDATREGDVFAWKDNVLVVQSATGIGVVDVRPGDEAWPEAFRIRFLDSLGQGMTRLEGLTLQGAGVEASGSWKDGRGSWEMNRDCRGSSLIAHWEFVDGAVELVVTAHSLDDPGEESLQIRWVDAYRR